jgi:hypothetical protein
MRGLRRKDRAITADEAMAILDKAEYGVLSTVSPDGKPYGVPLNFCISNHCVYFHCAMEGHKIENIETNRFVSFCVVGSCEILPDQFGTNYESAIVSGAVEEVFDNAKQIALEGLLKKYSSDYFEKGLAYIENLKAKTRVFKISIVQLSGKARKK